MLASLRSLALASCLPALGTLSNAQAGTVLCTEKISSIEGAFAGPLLDSDGFGAAVAALGDLNGDLVADLAVGAPGSDDPTQDSGAVWTLCLNPDGSTAASTRIAPGAGGFLGVLDGNDYFGGAVANAGDLNGDGRIDLAVGAPGDDDGGADRGAVWILFMNSDGTVWANWKISDLSGGFGGALNDFSGFGSSLAGLGDMDGDGVPDLAVGAPGDNDGCCSRGAVWILFMNANGTVKGHQKISATSGGSTGYIVNGYRLGRSMAKLNDLDGDGVSDLAVGSNDNGKGGIYVLFLNANGTVRDQQNNALSEPANTLPIESGFGSGLASVGDIDGDGVEDLAAGTTNVPSGGFVWVLFMKPDGTVRSYQPFGFVLGGFDGAIAFGDEFGCAVTALGDLNGDKVVDVAVGARGDDDGGPDRGAVWLGFLDCSAASVADRNGSGANPGTLYSATLPLLGTTWMVDLNCLGHSSAPVVLRFRRNATAGRITAAGEVLIGGPTVLAVIGGHNGDVHHFALPIPDDNALCGLRVHAQGKCFGAPAAQLSNAVDAILGH